MWFRVLGRLGRVESSSNWVWTDCSIVSLQINPDAAQMSERRYVKAPGVYLCSGKLMWKEISGKSLWLMQPIAEGTGGGAAALLLHLFGLRWSEVAAAQILGPNQGFLFPFPFPQPLMLSTGSEKCQNSGEEGVSFFATFGLLKPLLHHVGGRDSKYSWYCWILNRLLIQIPYWHKMYLGHILKLRLIALSYLHVNIYLCF